MTADAAAAGPDAGPSAPAAPTAPDTKTTAAAGTTGPDSSGTGAAGPKGSTGDAFDEAGSDAYVGGARALNPGAVTVMTAGNTQLTIHSYLGLGGRGIAATPGPVRGEQLDEVRGRYVEVPEYADLKRALQRRHLLVLVGPTGTGRSTTALHLLDVVANGKVSRLDDPHEVSPDSIERGRGYLAELRPRRDEPSQARADRLAEVLELGGAFCVLVTTPDPALRSAYSAYSAPCSAPDQHLLLAQHVDAQIRADDPDGLAERLLAQAVTSPFVDLLGPTPRPREVAAFAELLVGYGRGELTERQVRDRTVGFLDEQVAEWFAVLRGTSFGERAERARRLTALRIAAAVFDGMPRYYVTDTTETLAAWMAHAPALPSGGATAVAAPPARATPGPADAEDEVVLATSRLRVDRGEVRVGDGVAVATTTMRYRDPRTPAALLRCVWDQHMWLRAPVVGWLDGLGRHPSKVVRVRAAQATGLLCSFDFSHTFTALVEPAAKARPRRRDASSTEGLGGETEDEVVPVWQRRREFAAGALDHAARDPRVAHVAVRTLRRWRRSGDVAQQCTAAEAWGLDLGLQNLPVALEELRILGTPQEQAELDADAEQWGLLYVAGLSLTRLFATGAHHQVVALVTEWLGRRRQSLYLLAVQTILLMVDLRVSQVGRAGSPAAEDVLLVGEQSGPRARWPVLLALHDSEPDLARPAADLLRAALRSPWSRTITDSMGPWLTLAQVDASVLAAIEAMVPLLVRERSDAARLRYLVQRKRNAWADAVDPGMADRLTAVIDELDGAVPMRRAFR
jgi:hypothetical protein